MSRRKFLHMTRLLYEVSFLVADGASVQAALAAVGVSNADLDEAISLGLYKE